MKRSAPIGLACVAIAAFAACGDGKAMPERTCSGALALGVDELRGGSLPMKKLALTFDDGPGVRTAELSLYLKSQGIRAAFFVNGMNVARAQQLQTLVDDGHLVANHTQTHRSMTGRSTGTAHGTDAEIVSEVGQTDAIIAPVVEGGRWLFRAPFGDFDEQAYVALQASPMSKYVGAIGWDVGDHMGPGQAADWDCWTLGADGMVLSPAACAALYEKEIDSVGRGVVLMHDPYFIDDDPMKGGTVDMVMLLVPALQEKGYSFVRIDEVPDIAALLPPDAGAADDGDQRHAPASASARVDAGGGIPDPCPRSPHTKAENHGIGAR